MSLSQYRIQELDVEQFIAEKKLIKNQYASRNVFILHRQSESKHTQSWLGRFLRDLSLAWRHVLKLSYFLSCVIEHEEIDRKKIAFMIMFFDRKYEKHHNLWFSLGAFVQCVPSHFAHIVFQFIFLHNISDRFLFLWNKIRLSSTTTTKKYCSTWIKKFVCSKAKNINDPAHSFIWRE